MIVHTVCREMFWGEGYRVRRRYRNPVRAILRVEVLIDGRLLRGPELQELKGDLIVKKRSLLIDLPLGSQVYVTYAEDERVR
jgi:hypothetical protein